jgi:hypothetical protein
VIALQVAAGIVLAYIILVNRHKLLRWSKVLGLALLVLSLTAIAFYLLSLAGEALSASIGPTLSKYFSAFLTWLGMMLYGLFAFGSAALGGLCLSMLWDKLRGAEPSKAERENNLLIWSIANLIVTVTVVALLAYTPFDIEGAADGWSRENGYKDAGSFLLIAILLPWPAPLLWIVHKLNPKAEPIEPTSEDDVTA